jgi:serine/threonine protein phosphatase 1
MLRNQTSVSHSLYYLLSNENAETLEAVRQQVNGGEAILLCERDSGSDSNGSKVYMGYYIENGEFCAKKNGRPLKWYMGTFLIPETTPEGQSFILISDPTQPKDEKAEQTLQPQKGESEQTSETQKSEEKVSEMRKHILVIEENTRGENYILGDIHGSITLLQTMISSLNEHDQLHIVGDLIDRGPGNLEVIDLVYKHRPDGGQKPYIYSTLGNHEYMFLVYASHKLNGLDVSFLDWWIQHPANGATWVTQISDEQLRDAYYKIVNLPVIIYVNDKVRYGFGHADMPCDDETFFKKIATNEPLSPTEISHAIETRSHQDAFAMHRDEKSFRFYHGHDILQEHNAESFVHADGNSINLDIGAYFRNCLLVVAHKAERAFLVGKAPEDAADLIHKQIKRINAHIMGPENRLARAKRTMDKLVELTKEDKRENIQQAISEIQLLVNCYHYYDSPEGNEHLQEIRNQLKILMQSLPPDHDFTWFKSAAKDPRVVQIKHLMKDFSRIQESLSMSTKDTLNYKPSL